MTSSADGAGLHGLVEALSRRLHDYVDVAVGVRAESPDAAAADTDPRLEEAERLVGIEQARLHDSIATELGLDADLTMLVWDYPEATAFEEEAAGGLSADDFFLHAVVAVPPGASAEQLDRALEVLDDASDEVVLRLEEAGFLVRALGVARGELLDYPPGQLLDWFPDYTDDADDADDGNEGDDEPGNAP